MKEFQDFYQFIISRPDYKNLSEYEILKECWIAAQVVKNPPQFIFKSIDKQILNEYEFLKTNRFYQELEIKYLKEKIYNLKNKKLLLA